jgi:hypothetical protein
MNAEFWTQLQTESKIGSPDTLPFVELVQGCIIEIPMIQSDGSVRNASSLICDSPWIPSTSLGFPTRPALILMSIFLPESLQRSGIGTRVIAELEKRAEREGRLFAVGIIESEAMVNLCNKVGLKGCAPFSCYRPAK